MRVSLGKRFLLGTLGAPAGVLGSGVEGPRRNQLLIAQIMKILKKGKKGKRNIWEIIETSEHQVTSSSMAGRDRLKDRKLPR